VGQKRECQAPRRLASFTAGAPQEADGLLCRLDRRASMRCGAHIAEFLSAALETGEAAYIAHAIGTAARAKGMTRVAGSPGRSQRRGSHTRLKPSQPRHGAKEAADAEFLAGRLTGAGCATARQQARRCAANQPSSAARNRHVYASKPWFVGKLFQTVVSTTAFIRSGSRPTESQNATPATSSEANA
jgi:probable addiction module antidote protein